MKKFAIALAAVLMLAAAVASATWEPVPRIGCFGDMAATLCSKPFPLNVSTTFYVLAVLEEIEAIRGAEFKIAGYPTQTGPGYGLITATWNGLVIGNPINGIAIALNNPPVQGPIVHIGTLVFRPLNANWLGTNKVLDIEPTDSGDLIVADIDYNEVTVVGWAFVGNCVPNSVINLPWSDNDLNTGACQCEAAIPVEDTNWGSIKALY